MISDEGQKGIFDRLRELGFNGEMRFNEPLYQYTTFRLGGPCEIFLLPENTPDVRAAVRFFNEEKIPWAVLGGGSNVLFPDLGFYGGIIRIGEDMAEFDEEDDHLSAGAGMPMSRLMKFAIADGYDDFDFLVGIPGSVGGAVNVNAGTAGKWIDSLIMWAEAVNPKGDPIRFMRPKGSYRKGFTGEGNFIITNVAFKKMDAESSEIKRKMTEHMKAKVEAQPYGERSAGCVFKNPQDAKAWELIDAVGLRNHAIGGVRFSEKHCNFIVCSEGATSSDVLSLIQLAEERVSDEKGIALEREIVVLGFDIPRPAPELEFVEEAGEAEPVDEETASEPGETESGQTAEVGAEEENEPIADEQNT